MNRQQAVAILREQYGDDRQDVLESMCFGDCCLTKRDKQALVTLIYGGKKDES